MNIQRRDAMKLLLAISASGALAACGNQPPKEEVQTDPLLRYATKNEYLSAAEMALLSALAQTIIPKTDTAGAVEAGVPDVLQELLSGWGDDQVRQYWRMGLKDLQAQLNAEEDLGSFAKLPAEKRETVLAKFDADVFGFDADVNNEVNNEANNEVLDNRFYKDLKSTIGAAYYMSEPGATEELIYDPVPGDFKGCIPFADVGKAWAT